MNPHAIVIEPNPNRVKVMFSGKTLANTEKALVLREGKLPPVLYFPRDEVDMSVLQPTRHSTHCPFKGDAEYFTISVDGNLAENAVWSYPSPIPAVAQIKDYLAFYSEKVETIEEPSH